MSREGAVKFARWVFLVAGIVGLIEITPLFFLEGRIARELPPAITHPEFFYGFAVIVFTWQIAFLVISRDPERYVPLMPVLFLEKLLYPIVVAVLYMQGRASTQLFLGPVLDLIMLAAFVTVWVKLRQKS